MFVASSHWVKQTWHAVTGSHSTKQTPFPYKKGFGPKLLDENYHRGFNEWFLTGATNGAGVGLASPLGVT